MALGTKGDPLYLRVATDMRHRIMSGQWKPGDRIPPEMELCQTYSVSRITVRRAIEMLVDDKLLFRKRGKGSFVLNWEAPGVRDDHYTLAAHFSNHMQELGKDNVTTWASVCLGVPMEEVRRALGLGVGQHAMHLRRTRGVRGRPFVYFDTWFVPVEGMSACDEDYYSSLTALLRARGIVADRIQECIEATRPTAEVKERLGLSRSEPILKRTRTLWQEQGSYREHTVCYYVGSRYRYYIDFS